MSADSVDVTSLAETVGVMDERGGQWREWLAVLAGIVVAYPMIVGVLLLCGSA